MTTDQAALLAAVRAAPLDDTPRLVYADYLDDTGDPAYAEFIRLQVADAAGERVLCSAPGAKPGDGCNNSDCPKCWSARCRHLRMADLWRDHWAEWVPAAFAHEEFNGGRPDPFRVHVTWGVVFFLGGFVGGVRVSEGQPFADGPCAPCRAQDGYGEPTGRLLTVRGWGKCYYCNGTTVRPGVAGDLFRAAPITTVLLGRHRPAYELGSLYARAPAGRRTHPDARCRWHPLSATSGGSLWLPHYIPDALYERLAGADADGYYPDLPAARRALSRACVRYGREQAGLPPLVWEGDP